ncbi:MAG: YraN family protein [Yonghaparkia sp.]|nr:YraN family protein [Microcella sp.]
MARKDDLGRAGEQVAVDHLTAIGWQIIDRNWRCRQGELDIVARDGATTVVVEVKTRSSVDFGHPLDAITPRKLARLRRLAGEWSAAHPESRRLRLDVIGVVAGREGTSLDHLRGVG